MATFSNTHIGRWLTTGIVHCSQKKAGGSGKIYNRGEHRTMSNEQRLLSIIDCQPLTSACLV
jgi:hypothetical protein